MSSSTSSSRRRFHVPRRHPVVVDIGCSCRKPKLFSGLMHNYLPLSMKSSSNNNKKSTTLTASGNKKSRESSTTTSSLTNTTTTITNSTFSPCDDDDDVTTRSSSSASPKNYKKKKKKKKKAMAEESVAVEKVSSDPYMDFKESMLQMIVEKEIYQWEELRELLNLFLSLNSPYHHHLILRAFAEIWEGLFSPGRAR